MYASVLFLSGSKFIIGVEPVTHITYVLKETFYRKEI